MSPVSPSGDESFFGAATVMSPAAPVLPTRSSKRRQKLAAKLAAEEKKSRQAEHHEETGGELKSRWIAMAFSLAVHAFLLAVMAVLVVQGASFTSEQDVVIDGAIGGGGGNAGIGDPVSLDLDPLMPAAGSQAVPAMTTVDAVASTSMRGHPLGSINGVQETGLGGGSGNGFGGGDGDGFLRLPKGAVTAGSFAAWTVPQGIDNLGRKMRERGGRPGEPGESPMEGEVYFIVIRIKMPADRRTYLLSDLSGAVRGTDKYRQDIPDGVFILSADGRLERPPRSGRLDVKDRSVDIIMRVPGAEKLVQDTIELRSKLLKETQKLTLVFKE